VIWSTFCASARAPELRLRLRICSCVSNSHSIKSVRSSPCVPTIDPPDVGAAQLLVQLAGRPDRCEAEDLHRLAPQGLPLFWRWKSAAGRRPIPVELQRLIRRMARENPSWGEERIANELLLKLGLRMSPRTIRKYLPKFPPANGKPRGDQRWATFLKNHAREIIACDFCVAVTATFRILYVFVVMEHASRRLILSIVRTSNPNVLMMKPAQDRHRDDAADLL
jgi:hypothetical protein